MKRMHDVRFVDDESDKVFVPVVYHDEWGDYCFINSFNANGPFSNPIATTNRIDEALKFKDYEKCLEFCRTLCNVFKYHDFYGGVKVKLTIGVHFFNTDIVSIILNNRSAWSLVYV